MKIGTSLICLLLAGCASTLPPASTRDHRASHCAWPQTAIRADAVVADSRLFDRVAKGMLFAEIFELLGPATRDAGSGIYIMEWDSSDGRVLGASSQNKCVAEDVYVRQAEIRRSGGDPL